MVIPPRLIACFSQALGIPEADVTPELAYMSIPQWDSVAHMALVAEIENAFDLMLDTEEIIGLSSVAKGVEILQTHGAI